MGPQPSYFAAFLPLDAVFLVPVLCEGFVSGLDLERPPFCFDLASAFDFFAAALLADLPRRLGASLHIKEHLCGLLDFETDRV